VERCRPRVFAIMLGVLSVAIINYETPDLTAGCVRSIQRNPASETTEILVIDNGSSAATRDALRALDGIRLVETGVNGGFSAGVNRCLAESDPNSDVVVVLNSDTEVERGALDALAAAARKPGIGMAAPILLDAERRLQRTGHHKFPTLTSTWMAVCAPIAYLLLLLDAYVRHPTQYSAAEHRTGLWPMHVMGAVMAFDRDAWIATGSFDERYFMYLEETEWQRRLHDAGYRVELTADATVLHLHRGGDAAIAVPTLRYLDSARIYFGALGHRDGSIRAVLASALMISYAAFLIYGPIARFVPAHRDIVAASRPRAREAFIHALRGRTVPTPRGHAGGEGCSD
jgi:N-acetylglucosaminyl-diphospho-decaprenol L-rhamnosyltransferase